ncbi:MAG TPA: hypothetical protein VIX58_12140 [Anaerolineae bacterium]
MKVTINRNFCGHHPSACEQCFGEYLRHGVTDYPCVTEIEDDGKPEITATIKLANGYQTTLVVTDDNREEIIYDGWTKFVNLPSEAFEVKVPTGSDIRRLLREQEETKS